MSMICKAEEGSLTAFFRASCEHMDDDIAAAGASGLRRRAVLAASPMSRPDIHAAGESMLRAAGQLIIAPARQPKAR